MNNNYRELYDSRLNLLENIYLLNLDEFSELKYSGEDWKLLNIYSLHIQSTNCVKSILRDLPGSRFYSKMNFVNELNIIGSITRLIFDMYIKILYLKYCDEPNDKMQNCWEYQRIERMLTTTKHEFELIPVEFKSVIRTYEDKKEALKKIIKNYPKFHTQKDILEGREEKVLNLYGITKKVGIPHEKIYTDFIYLSQFTHASSFAMGLRIENNTLISVLPIVEKLLTIYLGITVEVLEIHNPNHVEFTMLKENYENEKKKRWH